MPINIVLHQPEIPQNTGNIARTCAAINSKLHLIKPLGFSIEDKYVRRAGMDYWNLIDVLVYEDLSDFFNKNRSKAFYFITTKAEKSFTDIKYPEDSYFIFGRESAGLPEDILEKNQDNCVRIPMAESARSLNLSNAAAIVAYEALRQNDFTGLCKKGVPRTFMWKN